MSPLTDVVAQIEAARDSSSMARKVGCEPEEGVRGERRRRWPFSPSTGADAVPARKFGRGMGFSSGPKSPEAKKEQGPKPQSPFCGRARPLRARGSRPRPVGAAEAKEEVKSNG